MISQEALQARITKLKEMYQTRLSEVENPRANPDLRVLRKKLKRSQRKLQLLKAAERKEQKKSEKTG